MSQLQGEGLDYAMPTRVTENRLRSPQRFWRPSASPTGNLPGDSSSDKIVTLHLHAKQGTRLSCSSQTNPAPQAGTPGPCPLALAHRREHSGVAALPFLLTSCYRLDSPGAHKPSRPPPLPTPRLDRFQTAPVLTNWTGLFQKSLCTLTY